jgi:PAS domain S-box-containing protein
MTSTTTLGNHIVQSKHIGFAILNYHNKFVEVNDTFCQLYGYAPDELLGQPASVLLPEQYLDQARLSYQKFVKGDTNQAFRYIQRKDGTARYVHQTLEELPGEGPALRLLSLVAVDQKGQPTPEPPPEVAEVRACGEVGMLQCTLDGELITVDSNAKKLLGLTSTSVLDREVVVLSRGTSQRMSFIRLLQQNTLLTNQEVLVEHPQYQPVWLLANAQMHQNAQGERYFLVCLVNISAQKQLEESLREQTEDLEQENHRLELFTYRATHDLKAPLASVLGLIDIVRMEQEEAQREAYLQMMEKSIHRLNDLIRDIVDYAKNTSEAIRHEKIDFQELVADVLESLDHMEHAEAIEKTITIHQTHEFHSDKHRLNRVLENLISNAYKYSSTHRRDGFVQVEVKVTPSKAHIQVRDNGQGIDPMHHDKIFTMFYRASEQGSGSGLGLYLVKDTVEQMGGTITVSSAVGQGTCFTLNIPHSQPASSGQMKIGFAS